MIEGQYDDGLLSEEDRKEQLRVLWDRATDEVAQAMEDNLDELNPIFMMANSGARGSFKQIRQLAGMRGLMANPKGEIIERPIKSNFMEGLSVLEYFISTHGARKGLADTALRTADSGYLTRRLVDVSQDVIIRSDDCKTKDYVEAPLRNDDGELNLEPDRPHGREEVRDQARARAAEARARRSIWPELEEIAEAFGDEDGHDPAALGAQVRARAGVCRACYGRALATGSLVEIGDAVGIIAAQSIGEPGTQLTMRTFHTGGVAGLDITQGLPRVVELFEARKPKGMAEMAEVEGKVAIEETDKEIRLTITDGKGEEHPYKLPPRARLLVKHGDRVEAGTQLEEGSLYPADLLRIRGRTAIELYLVREVQRVYKAQGVDINDKHIELIVRQMLKRVRIDAKGSTDAAARRARGSSQAQAPQQAGQGRGRHAGEGRGGDPRDHQGLAGDRVVPLGRLLPGDDEGAHRRRPRGQARQARRPQGERDHRQADPGRDRPAHYRTLEIEPVEPAQRPEEDLLDEEELAAELGLAEDGDEVTELEGFGPSFAEELEELAQEIETGDGAPRALEY